MFEDLGELIDGYYDQLESEMTEEQLECWNRVGCGAYKHWNGDIHMVELWKPLSESNQAALSIR